MTAEELMTIANMGKGTDMSSYEHFMMAEKSARRPSGVGIAGLAIANGDLKKATEMYDFFAKDMQLPDTDPVVPTTFQQIKETAGTILGWFNEHQDDVTRTFNFIQSIRKGEPIINTPTTPPVDIPPLPTE